MLGINTDATRLLGEQLDIGLQVRAHKYLSLEKTRRADDKILCLRFLNELTPGLIQRIQVATV